MESLITAAESRKRLLEQEETNDDKSPYRLMEPPSMSKRRIVAGAASASASSNSRNVSTLATKPPSFLLFHLKMLKSLYENETSQGVLGVQEEQTGGGAQANISETEPNEKSLLSDDTIWQSLQEFLKERTKILQAQADSKNSQAVHLAAVAHLGESSSTTTTTNSSRNCRGGESLAASPDPIFRRRSHEQATHSPTILQSPLNKALHTSFASAASQTTKCRNSFRLVTVLLQKRAATLQTHYTRAAAPHARLHAVCRQEITHVTARLASLQQALGESTRTRRQQLVESPKTPLPDNATAQTEHVRCAMAAAAAKLKLWKLLEQDLVETQG